MTCEFCVCSPSIHVGYASTDLQSSKCILPESLGDVIQSQLWLCQISWMNDGNSQSAMLYNSFNFQSNDNQDMDDLYWYNNFAPKNPSESAFFQVHGPQKIISG